MDIQRVVWEIAGASPERPATNKVVRIGDCSKGHLKTCSVSQSALNWEARLLLARAGKVQSSQLRNLWQ